VGYNFAELTLDVFSSIVAGSFGHDSRRKLLHRSSVINRFPLKLVFIYLYFISLVMDKSVTGVFFYLRKS